MPPDPLRTLLAGETEVTALRRDLYAVRAERGAAAARNALEAVAVRRVWSTGRLAAALRCGPGQVVFFGCGMDTRPRRLLVPGLAIYEVETAAALGAKEALLSRAPYGSFSSVPTPVAADLERPPEWQAALASAGFDASRPAVWVVEDVLCRLAWGEAQAVLQAAARGPLGTTVIADCPTPATAELGRFGVRCPETCLSALGFATCEASQLGDPSANFGGLDASAPPVYVPGGW
ncbi:leucine carboxyl methyltransferase-domain-containing protein, partial [Tribonema minus]